jgi:hypothetical protein
MFFGVGTRAVLVFTAAAYLRSNLSQTSSAIEPLNTALVLAVTTRNEKALHVQGLLVADL